MLEVLVFVIKLSPLVVAQFLYYSHLLVRSFCHHAAPLAEQHKLALLVPGDQAGVLLKQTDRAVKYRVQGCTTLRDDVFGEEIILHFHLNFNILDNEDKVRCRNQARKAPTSSCASEG